MRAAVYAFVAVLGLTPALAVAASGPSLEIYQAGDYAGAIKAGLAENNENGFDVAARAALAQETLRDAPCMSCLKQAEGYARRAIAAGGTAPESYVYLAAALGHQSRIMGPIRARVADYPAQARAALDTAYRLNPNFSWTLAALGGWNIEVVRVGGSWLGDLLFDVSVDKGVAYFKRATAAEPGNLVIHFQFALALASYDLDGQRALVQGELVAAAGGKPTSAYETAIKERARGLADLVSKHRDAEADALVRKYQGYP